jgi:DNA-binding NarL/FixJ family response regulator
MTAGEAEGPTRVLVVDDHPIWRDAVARDLTEAGFEVAASLGEAGRAVRLIASLRCRVAVVDLHLPDLSGPEMIRGLLEKSPDLRILVLSASGEQQDVLDAVKAGASGYLLKSAGSAELVDATRRTAAGDAVFTPGLAALVLGEYRRLTGQGPQEPDTPRLTERETQVLRLVATGLSYKQIAERLTLSHRTVQNHVQNTLTKLQLHNRVELVRYALDNGLGDAEREPRKGI